MDTAEEVVQQAATDLEGETRRLLNSESREAFRLYMYLRKLEPAIADIAREMAIRLLQAQYDRAGQQIDARAIWTMYEMVFDGRDPA